MNDKPKMIFHKDPHRDNKILKPVKETTISVPKSTFDVSQLGRKK